MDFIDFFKKANITDFIEVFETKKQDIDTLYNPSTQKYEDVYIYKSIWYVDGHCLEYDVLLNCKISNTLHYKEKIYYLLDNNFYFELELLNYYKVNIFAQFLKIIENKNILDYKDEIQIFMDYYKNDIQKLTTILEKEIGNCELHEKYECRNMKNNLLTLCEWYKKDKTFCKSIDKIIHWYKN